MVKIADLIKDEIDEDIRIPGADNEAAAADRAQEEYQSGGFSLNFEWLRKPTGEGTIEEYIDHPLNLNHSKGLAQVLRGVTGIAGDLKLAIIDIVFGLLNFTKERKAAAHGAVDSVRQ